MKQSNNSETTCQGIRPSFDVTSTRASAGESSEGVQAPITCTPQVVNCTNIYSGIDTLHLSVFVDLENSILIPEIEAAREIAREYERDAVPFTYFSPQWNVHRSGRRHFRYHLSMADTHVYFNTRSANGKFPTCLIEIGSLSCHCPGPFEVFKQIESFFESSGVVTKRHAVIRVDLSTDFVNVDINELDIDRGDQWISRARNFSVFQNNWNLSGVSLGKGSLMARIYEKRIELNEKKAFSKSDFFNRQWGLMSTDKKTPVVRVEFQFRSDVLREFQSDDDCFSIETLADLKESLNGLWGYASKIWLRQADKAVDRKNKNHSQSTLSFFWSLVQSVDFDADKKNLWRKKKKKDYVNIDALIEQGVGCLVAATAASLEKLEDWKQIPSKAASLIWNRLNYLIKYDMEKIYEKVHVTYNLNNLNPAGLNVTGRFI